jgi:hypothetical protein
MALYKIVRMYRDGKASRTIETGLTLQEAQAHCRDPETSSSTATGAIAKARTRRHGPWFDGYEEMPAPKRRRRARYNAKAWLF